ncbi:MAG TPA: DUF1326 domain-containing protein [Xanthobacteraceae bacterium]|nr:DUF1326 domain-containing protein [Xanthobacteraceae bacterium]
MATRWDPDIRANEPWHIKGELALSCNCTVFCPCVLSLGQHAPTEGYCQTWAGVRIDNGRFGDVDLSGLKFGFMADIPGRLARGNWTMALFVDDKATAQAVKALTWIMTGRAGGSTGLLKILAGSFLGVRQIPITYEIRGETRIIQMEKIIDGALAPVKGKDQGGVVIRNSEYWIAPDVTVARAEKSRFRLFGRNWNFEGRSAEICRLDWGNQK